jgi:hypothetical protein
MSGGDVARAAAWAAHYKVMGLNPLPSRAIDGRIRPALRAYTDLRDKGIGDSILRRWWTDCIQVCLGKVVVVDLDGPAARQVWREWSMHRRDPPTWEVEHDPAGGMHLWYATEATLPFKTVLWTEGDGLHSAVEVLGDRNLIVAPPSRSPKSGNRYRFRPGRGPRQIERPAPLPGWVLRAVENARPLAQEARVPLPRPEPALLPRHAGPHYEWRSVQAAIPDPLEVLAGWGVRVVGGPTPGSDWVAARSIYREDRHPSASVSHRTGCYKEPGAKALSIFDLGVALGVYPDLCHAIDDLGRRFGAPIKERRAL